MKNLKTIINRWLDRFNGQWRTLPLKKQQRYMLLLFAGYALLSVVVLLKVCYDVGNSGNGIKIEHIENPVIQQKKSPVTPQDSIRTILKRKMYER
ncbi:nitrogen regulatory IIA protein [Niabella beijingensis]|uniref:nitrogen regulatory IIA protein n=1 Tax=Niabella beijingensis TaxID=2872700 RepID=UPI001CBDB52D|nr:nitrogen regulatory IIA protein [Niabella beijingensis]MBZ4192031.1 nitrogen regulatory IIA protein [Niabella beijingensis]